MKTYVLGSDSDVTDLLAVVAKKQKNLEGIFVSIEHPSEHRM